MGVYILMNQLLYPKGQSLSFKAGLEKQMLSYSFSHYLLFLFFHVLSEYRQGYSRFIFKNMDGKISTWSN
jgi:hypothetical protein